MNIFNSIKQYNSWRVENVRNFADEEKELISSVSVVEGDFSLSACFIMVNGSKSYIPMDINTSASAGDILDKNTLKLITLVKPGENPIFRVSEK